MRGFRIATANVMTFTTDRGSLDLTCANCSRGSDVDPDVEVVRRRVMGFRRTSVVHREAASMVSDIFNKYCEQGHPGTCNTLDDANLEGHLLANVVAGEPTSRERARLRSQCKPHGPAGYLLESLHLQASAMDIDYVVHQGNQPDIMAIEAPYQHLSPMVRQLCCRHRTIAADSSRDEAKYLHEIDAGATDAGQLGDEDRIILDITRT